MTITPSLVMRWPASRSSRLAASSGSTRWRALYRNCTAVDSLLTFCPPGPEARTKEISRSFSSIERSRAIRSMASPNEWSDSNICIPVWPALLQMLESRDHQEAIPSWNRADRRITVLCAICLTDECSIGLQRRSGNRLGGGLRRTADNHGQQTVAPQPARSLFGLVDGHRIDERITLLHI